MNKTRGSRATDGPSYLLPDAGLRALSDAVPPPRLLPSPDGRLAAVLRREGRPSVAQLAQPERRLAGLRWSPRLAAATREDLLRELSIMDLSDGRCYAIDGLPGPLYAADCSWSPDGGHLAFSHRDEHAGEVQLWCIDVRARHARQVLHRPLHAITSVGFAWVSDSQRLLVMLRPESIGPEPDDAPTLMGPVVEDSTPQDAGRATRTFADLLRTDLDEQVLAHHLLNELAWTDLQGRLSTLGAPGLHVSADPSPDSLHVLVQRLERPFSRRVPVQRFARTIEVLDTTGARLHQVARLDAAERLPASFDAVPGGPREVHWRTDADACLAWVEAADDGDHGQPHACRDTLWVQAAPFAEAPRCIARLPLRFGQVAWGHGSLAVVMERWWQSRTQAYWCIAPDVPNEVSVRFHTGSLEDRYADPGQAVQRADCRGRMRLVTIDPNTTLWIGSGSSPEGDRPFIDRWNLRNGQRQRCFWSPASHHEEPLAALDATGSRWLTTRETPDSPPQHRVITLLGGQQGRDLTHWPHPTPQLRGLRPMMLRYERADGVPLGGTLWLPPGHDPQEHGPLPLLMWAYPTEYVDAAVAGQVTGSPRRFQALDPLGPIAMVAAGYAVLDHPSMPIISRDGQPGNDSFVRQLVDSAQAAVEEVVRKGVAERHRIAIGGHSFGAFMAANLLAHTRLFRAGIARSGAYNRTLTPFGFQSEQRHYWQAREMYRAVSPFDEAHQIEAPLLLIHGMADTNSGTFPMQSERMFAALRTLGSTSRLVLLPHEGHRYVARESVLHVLAETRAWLDRHVKEATSPDGPPSKHQYPDA
jgi:dipeptidyl aminopeptidase/acylaminoacyl peptidase